MESFREKKIIILYKRNEKILSGIHGLSFSFFRDEKRRKKNKKSVVFS